MTRTVHNGTMRFYFVDCCLKEALFVCLKHVVSCNIFFHKRISKAILSHTIASMLLLHHHCTSVIRKSLVISTWVHDFISCALKFHSHFYSLSTTSSCTSCMMIFSSVIVALDYHMPILLTLRFPARFFLSWTFVEDFCLRGRAECFSLATWVREMWHSARPTLPLGTEVQALPFSRKSGDEKQT